MPPNPEHIRAAEVRQAKASDSLAGSSPPFGEYIVNYM